MAHKTPSIQSFFQAQSIPSESQLSSSPKPGDGYTAQELHEALRPTVQETWSPPAKYADRDIADLLPGPECISFMGRVVNVFEKRTPPADSASSGSVANRSAARMPRGAKGFIKIIVRDDSGAVTVRIWYSRVCVAPRLGQLVAVWATHVSSGENGNIPSMAATTPMHISIFPERESGSHLIAHTESDDGSLCRAPPDCSINASPNGLMTLKNLIDGGYEIVDVRILVIIKSIGARKRITNIKGEVKEVVRIDVFDNTADATLTLWEIAAASVVSWKPSHTVLLITDPGLRIESKTYISLTSGTHVDVDPDIPETQWMREFAEGIVKRDNVNEEYPSDVFDAETLATSDTRVLYTLAEVDDEARAKPKDPIYGYLSVLVTELNIVLLHRRNVSMCEECCTIPIYANNTMAICKQCHQTVGLRPNPRMIGKLLDETGQIASGKLILSDLAWNQILDMTPAILVSSSTDTLKSLEQRLLYTRITLVFGWSEEVGKLAVARVMR